ncbi:MAG TPA: hypothetical protein VFU15_10425 [Bacteroidia bacterium]|nr:hypothetical protein [Bacteroidia bacterium]
MKRTIFILLLFPLLFGLGRCKNDVNLLTDYKNYLVCYGLLDPNDTVHYIRLSKVFLGEGSAYDMASNPDTANFRPGTADVFVERWLNGVMITSWRLTPDTTIARDTGIFSNPYQVLYRGNFPVLKDGSIYKLYAKDVARGDIAQSETKIVQDPVITYPAGNFTPLNLYDTTTIRFGIKTGTNGVRYNLFVRFHYKEQFVFDTTEVSDKYIDWQIGTKDASDDLGGEAIDFTIRRNNFLSAVAALIPVNPDVRRIAGTLDFYYTGASSDLKTYMDVGFANSNSTSPIATFTNITGGLGLFASRTTSIFPNYSIDANTKSALRNNTETVQLGFIR